MGQFYAGVTKSILKHKSFDKAKSKIFQYNFASLPLIVIGKFLTQRFCINGSLFYSFILHIFLKR